MKEILEVLQRSGITRLTPYFEHPVADQNALKSLKQRAEAFEYNGRAIPCSIIPELTFDMGSRRLNSQLLLAVIDTSKSKALMGEISRKLGYQPTPENTGAALISERRFAYRLSRTLSKPAWVCEELVLVIRLEDGGRISQHLITPSAMKSLVGPTADGRNNSGDVSQFNALVPSPADCIRGLNDAAAVWNGNAWGLAEFAPDGNLIVGSRTVATGKLERFGPADLAQPLRVSLAGPHGEYHDLSSGLIIPGPATRGRPGFRDWFMQQSDVPVVVVEDPADVGGGSGGGSPIGSQPSSDITWIFRGTDSCARDFNTMQSCYACCDAMAMSALALGATTAASVTATVAAILIPGGGVGIVITVAVAVVAFSAAAIVAFAVAQACKDACDNPTRAGQVPPPPGPLT